MKPRFVGRLGPADAITLANAGIGFLAVVIAFADAELAARLVLLAAVADGLDGVVARAFGGSPAGEYLDDAPYGPHTPPPIASTGRGNY